jgi:cathepsin B
MLRVGLLAVVLVGLSFCSGEERLYDDTLRLVPYINRVQSSWTAGENIRFRGVSMRSIARMMGNRPLSREETLTIPLADSRLLPLSIPDSFDARAQWGKLCPTIGTIEDQSECGSCWAFGMTEAAQDRICIHSEGKLRPQLSVNDVMTCCVLCGFGCNGGYSYFAWRYWVKQGIVTGSNYTAKTGCQPYHFPPCEHHVSPPHPHFKPCPSTGYPTPPCYHGCHKGYAKTYKEDKHFGSKAYRVGEDVEAIQKEILTNGPVAASFYVYEDFLHYKSGVYQHVTGKYEGGHAIKILGWGEENGKAYWLVANSWNYDWGDKGFFKILRGKDECGIEEGITAGLP